MTKGLTDATDLAKKRALRLARPNVLDHGVAEDDVELAIAKRERGAA